MRLLPTYCLALAAALSSSAVIARIGRGRTVRASIGLILLGAALLALLISAGPWVITAAMCLINIGFGGLFAPIYDTVLATVAPGQNGRAVAMNDLAMQGGAALGIGMLTPWLASGYFRAVAAACVLAAAISIVGDWVHEHLYRRGR